MKWEDMPEEVKKRFSEPYTVYGTPMTREFYLQWREMRKKEPPLYLQKRWGAKQ